MKVFLPIWILAVLIQEVIPSTLVRLPRHAEKNLSLVHTEYEAKYEQKGKHGNESFSSVSGKQEIVHDNCAENWNSFAEKCASLIKDLVASLANAVSSKPGDATNLQLHIKNTFRHFDNTHNCTCLNHTGKTLSDLNLSPLFKNITINTVEPSTKTDAKYNKYGEKGQPCDGDNGSDIKEVKNIMFESNGVGGDKNGSDQKQLKENGQPLDEFSDEHNDKPQTGNAVKSKVFDEKLAEEQKQQNRALIDAEDLDMNPENAEGSSDQSTNNSRRQIKYPENLVKPQQISKNSGDSDFNPLADDLKHSPSNPKRPESVRYPFLVTVRPNFQSAKPIESPPVGLNPPSLSGTSLESDFPNSPEYEPSHVLLPEENSSASTAVSMHNSSVKSNGVPPSASYLLTSPNNGNSSPKSNYLYPAPQVVTESHSPFYNEEDPKEEVLPSNNPESYQKQTSLPINPVINKNNESPAAISEEPFTENYNLDSAVLVPAKSVNNKPQAQSPVELINNSNSETEDPIIDNQALKPILKPVQQLKNDHKLVPSVMQPEKPITSSKLSGQPIDILPEPPLLVDSSNAEAALPLKLINNEPSVPSSVIFPEESVIGSHVLKPGLIPAEQVEYGPDAISSPITESSQQPTIILPDKPNTEGSTSDLSKVVPENYKSPANIPAVLTESAQPSTFPEEFSPSKPIKSESPGVIPKNQAENNYNSESPLFIQNKKPIEEPSKEWLQFTTPRAYDLDKTSTQENTKPVFTMHLPEEDQDALKKLSSAIPELNSNKKIPESSEPGSVTLNPSLIYDPLIASSSSKPPSDQTSLVAPGKNPAILSPEDILPVADNGKPLFEEPTTIKSPIYKPSSVHSGSKPSSGAVMPGKNPAILSPEDILPVADNGKPLFEEPTTIKSPIYKPSSVHSGSKPSSGAVMPGKNPAILSPEDILPVADNGKPFFEEPTTIKFDQTIGYGRDHTISMVKPISTVPEAANQESGISTPIEKLRDKTTVPETILPQKPFFGPQNSDKEVVNVPMNKLQYPEQPNQEDILTTPLPFYPVKTVTVIPATGQKLNSQPAMVVKSPEIYESQGKDSTVTEIPTASKIPEAAITKGQQRQPSIVVVGDMPQNEVQVNTPIVVPEIASTTPVIIYPVKSLPISPQSPEQSYPESSHPVLVNTGFSDDNQKPEVQAVLITTPVPISPVKSIQDVPVITEQQNGNAGVPMQPTATTESCLTSDSPNEQEHTVLYAPVRESDNVQQPQVIVKPDKIPSQLARPNFDDQPQSPIDLNPVPSSTNSSETTPVISSKSQPETVIPSTLLKPAQPGVLIQNTEGHPHQEEIQNPLLIQPTTFQTTSEDPTPSQVNVPGLLTHTTSVPQDSDETMPIQPSTSPKTISIYGHDDDEDEDCCSCESCTEEEITDPKQYKETACKNLEEARKELKAIFDKIKKKLKCGRKAPQTITSS